MGWGDSEVPEMSRRDARRRENGSPATKYDVKVLAILLGLLTPILTLTGWLAGGRVSSDRTALDLKALETEHRADVKELKADIKAQDDEKDKDITEIKQALAAQQAAFEAWRKGRK